MKFNVQELSELLNHRATQDPTYGDKEICAIDANTGHPMTIMWIAPGSAMSPVYHPYGLVIGVDVPENINQEY